ncbi:MAG: NAD+ synthase (glutamine-hydrolyzing) [Cellvibrionaceae bacterium]|jgi:NAD+ synthase (glutamine-hydrolysing)
MSTVKVVLAQINPLVGDIQGNTQRVVDVVKESELRHQADVVIFPELTLCAYPPEDLLLRSSMQARIERSRKYLQEQTFTAIVILGYPLERDGARYNMAGVLSKNRWVAEYAKHELPNYEVFDEKRYFQAGTAACVFDLHGIPTALTICEDIWHYGPMAIAREQGAKLMINISASPFHREKQQQRLTLLGHRALEGQMPIIYVNQVGGQDELVFDGCSFAVDAQGQCCAQAPAYRETLHPLTIKTTPSITIEKQRLPAPESDLQHIYNALVLGLKDYVDKNGFKQVILGLSGGIDSSLTLAIAVDALGAERISAFMMPFTYTSDLSRRDAADQAKRLNVEYQVISIEPIYRTFMSTLAPVFANRPADLTEQNLQARCRGVILMAISNKTGSLVLTTGNKSELAVGYSTLYGDMAGGFDVLKDVPKMMVFSLANYRNELGEAIPPSVIKRPPSAELAPDQKDEDNLPPYEILDEILWRYIDADASADAIIADGFDPDTVYKVIRLVDINEYKRRQAPLGVRISQKGFGRDRRYPVTNAWKPGH